MALLFSVQYTRAVHTVASDEHLVNDVNRPAGSEQDVINEHAGMSQAYSGPLPSRHSTVSVRTSTKLFTIFLIWQLSSACQNEILVQTITLIVDLTST